MIKIYENIENKNLEALYKWKKKMLELKITEYPEQKKQSVIDIKSVLVYKLGKGVDYVQTL